MKLPYKIHPAQEALTLLVLAAPTAASFWLYANFPDSVATHWNFAGDPDSYSGRAFAAFFFPALAWFLYLLLTFLPIIDPKANRYEEFANVYNAIRFLMVALFAALYALASLAGLGYDVRVGVAVPGLIGVLFIALGMLLPNIKRNWFVGIRTPWTMSSELVWNETHRVGSALFVLSGVAFIAIPFLPAWLALPLFIAVMALLLVGTVGYSWWVWKKTR